jgi:outer membrane protein assembly factor BamA
MTKVSLYKYLLPLMMICCSNKVWSQNFHLLIRPVDTAKNFVRQELKLKKDFGSKPQCMDYVKKLPSLLQSKGYLSASVDSIQSDSSRMLIDLFVGEQYKWKRLRINEKDKLLLNQVDKQNTIFDSPVVDQSQIIKLQQKLLDYFENNGYPFASVAFTHLVLDGREVSADLEIDKGILYKMDSLITWGNGKINKNFLYHYFGLSEGSLYNRECLEKINRRLLELPYLQQSQPWALSMLASSYRLNLYLQSRQANQIDAIAGFIPASSSEGSKPLFTVDVKLKLQNAFASGETIALNWQQLQPQSPALNFIFQRPYLFNSSFGLDLRFDLYKKDSAYLNLNVSAGVQYILSARQKAKIALKFFRSNLMDIDTIAIQANKKLPDAMDMSSTDLSLEYEWMNTNYQFNPSKGTEFTLEIDAGNKTIRRNSTITQIKDPAFNYSQLYDSIRLHAYRLKLKLSAAWYFQLGKHSVIKEAFCAGVLESPDYFTNELFRIGGYRLLRGFDEESIFTNRYAVETLEYRYLLGMNSYFFGFTDIGAGKNHITTYTDHYIAAGIGLAFETKKGIFNISVANGKRNNLPLNIMESKIHLGFMSIF